MILIPKYKTVYLNQPLDASLHVKGEFRFVKYNSMGQVNQDTGWLHNTWLDQGLDLWAADGANFANYMALGTGTTPVTEADTSLSGTFLASTNDTNGTNDYVIQAGAPGYEQTVVRNRRFDAGEGTGVIGEVGMCKLSGNPGTTLAIRSLVVPTVNKLSDEVLDVFYKWTIYPQLEDATGTVTIDSLDYNYIMRGAGYTIASIASNLWALPTVTINVTTQSRAYNDPVAIGTYLDNLPTGYTNAAYTDTTGWYNIAYTPGNHYRDQYFNVGLNGWNVPNGIRAAWVTAYPWNIKFRFGRTGGGDEAIPKDNTKVIENFRVRWSWARADAHIRAASYVLTGVNADLTEVVP